MTPDECLRVVKMQLPSYICCFLYCLLDHFLRINALNPDGHKAQRYTVSKSISREMFQREPSVLLGLSVLAPIGSTVNLVILWFLACRSTAGASHEWVISSTAGFWTLQGADSSLFRSRASHVAGWLWTQHVVEYDSELRIFMTSFPKCRNYGIVLPCPVYMALGTESRAWYMWSMSSTSWAVSPALEKLRFWRNSPLWGMSITFFFSAARVVHWLVIGDIQIS